MTALVAGVLAVSAAFGPAGAQREVPDAAKRPPLGLDAVPEAARGPVSQALGHGDRAYHVRHSLRGLTATSRPQRLDATFTPAGVQVRSGRARLSLAARRLGYGHALRTVAWAPPQADANRVAYRRGALVEWYANGPLGLEQGFTLRSRPAAPRSGPLTIELGLSGNLAASLERSRDGVRLRGPGGSLRYTGLIASDSRGRTLQSWLELRGRRLLVRVDDRGALYPLQIDPFIQHAKLTASDGTAADQLGESVAVAGDTVVVGAPFDDVGANVDQGSAYVFQKPAAGWASATETAKLTASDGGADNRLGLSVGVAGDTLVAGAPRGGIGGAAYVFQKPAGGWASATETAKLTASDLEPFDDLGLSVAVAGDTVVAGAPGDDTGSNIVQGSAYLFVKPAAGWASTTETAKLTASDGAGFDFLGNSVAVAGDTVVAGAANDDVGANADQGSAYVFQKPATGWASTTETAKLTVSDGAASDFLGNSVAVAGDTVVAGAANDDVGANADQGSAYVFQKPATGWASTTETAKLTASDGAASDFLGNSVAVAGDTVVAGARLDDVGGNSNQGSAYVFQKPATGWANANETANLIASDGAAHDVFGTSVAVAGDTVVAGAPFDNVGASPSQGSAYVFADVVPNQPPACAGVTASPDVLSPATREMKLISLSGATDPDGDPVTYRIDGVSQDEPVTAQGDDTTPDAQLTAAGASSNQVLVRAERNPQRNGRIYRIAYTVSDGKGGSCSRTAGVGGNTGAKVAVPRQKNQAAVDDGDTNSWNSFTGAPVFGTLP